LAAVPLAREQGIIILGYPTTQVLQIPVPLAGETLCLAALAYPSESRLRTVLADTLDETLLRDEYDRCIGQLFASMAAHFSPQSVNVALSHLFVAGGHSTDSERPIEVGGAYTVRPASLPAASQYVALGHLHRPQDVKQAPTIARYAGSPLAFSFSEAGYAKSVTIVEAHPQRRAEIREIPLSSGKPLVRWKARGGLEEVWRWLEEGRDKGAWVDLEIDVQHALSLEEIHRLRKAHPGLIHIRPVFPEAEQDQHKTSQKRLSLEEQFVRFYKRQTGGAEPETALVRLFLELVNEEREEQQA
jgi:exonuclease SbcD